MSKLANTAYEFLGIRVHALTKSDLLATIEDVVESGTPNSIIGNHNLHSLYLLQHSTEMQRFYDENLYTHVDGMSLILLAKVFGVPLSRIHRTGYLDWFDDFLHLAEKQSWKIYFLGGKPNVADNVPAHFRAIYPHLQIRSHHGYDAFTPDTTVYAEIKAFAPHVLLVGMGMPLQEKWIIKALSFSQINVQLILPCGAIMDYYMGEQRSAPRWLGQLGLEWLYRLVHDPQRLFFRYIIEPVMLVPLFLRKLQKRKSDGSITKL